MSDEIFARLAAYRADLDGVAAPNASPRRPSHRRWSVIAACTIAAAGLVGLVAIATGRSTHHVASTPETSDVSVPTPVTTTTTSSTPTTTTVTTSLDHAAVTSRWEFSTDQVVAGGRLEGWLVIDNQSGAPLEVTDRGCAPKWAAVLTNDDFPPVVAFRMDCQLAPLVVPVGTSQLPVTVMAGLNDCTQDTNSIGIPQCLPEGGMPPLPIGSYTAVMVGSIPGVDPPAPIPIDVIAAD